MDEVASAYSIRSGFDGALMAEKKGKGMVKADAEDVRTRPAMRIGVDSIIFSWSKDYTDTKTLRQRYTRDESCQKWKWQNGEQGWKQ